MLAPPFKTCRDLKTAAAAKRSCCFLLHRGKRMTTHDEITHARQNAPAYRKRLTTSFLSGPTFVCAIPIMRKRHAAPAITIVSQDLISPPERIAKRQPKTVPKTNVNVIRSPRSLRMLHKHERFFSIYTFYNIPSRNCQEKNKRSAFAVKEKKALWNMSFPFTF